MCLPATTRNWFALPWQRSRERRLQDRRPQPALRGSPRQGTRPTGPCKPPCPGTRPTDSRLLMGESCRRRRPRVERRIVKTGLQDSPGRPPCRPTIRAATKHGPPLLSAPALDLSILFILFILSKTCTGSCLVAV